MSERSFVEALRQCRSVLRAHNINIRQSSRRGFTSSSSRLRTSLPKFQITSANAPLTDLLTTLRLKVFFPAALNTPQRKLIYKTRHHAMLLSDPITVDIDDEEFTLEPINIVKDVPHSWKSIEKAMELMGENRADWNNLTKLLVAMRKAGRKWKEWQWERIMRRAGDAGMAEEVLEMIRQTEATGLRLGELRLVREAMWACRERAFRSNWGPSETYSALRCAEQLAQMLEEEVHTELYTKGNDPRVQADIMGIVLELAAVNAQRHLGRKDQDGKVEMYAKRLVPHLREIPGLDFASDEGLLAARADYELLRWMPVSEALKVSTQVLGDNMPQAEIAEKRLAELETLCRDAAELVEAADESGQDKRKGLKWFKEAQARFVETQAQFKEVDARRQEREVRAREWEAAHPEEAGVQKEAEARAT